MVKLTEEMVAARTRMSDCTTVKKLNCWGTELTDVSILRRMKNVEVLSLSVNSISSLADFQNCIELKDLFVRKNNIKDLNEVCYLQALPKLKNLWLGENPCAEYEGYRLAVIKALPNLEKLDDKVISPEEAQSAIIKGVNLVHPMTLLRKDSPSPPSGRGSPEILMTKYSKDQDLDQRRNYSSSDEQRSYEEASVLQEYHETDKRNANHNLIPVQQYTPTHNRYSYEQNGRKSIDNNSRNNNCADNSPPIKMLEGHQDDERYRYNGEYDDVNQRLYTPTSPRSQYPLPEYSDEPQRPPSTTQMKRGIMNHSMEDFNQSPSWSRRNEKERRRSQVQYQRRQPMTRNSNLLSAVLCLVKELDYPSLEVVEMAVRSRIDELEE